MAEWYVKDKSVRVVSGDTLWGIAEEYRGKGILYKELATINKIKDPNKISVGQIIELYGSGSPGGSSGSTSNKNPARPEILQFGEISSEPGKLFVTWECGNHDKSESYKTLWTYYISDEEGIWFEGRKGTISIDEDDLTTSTQDTYTIPANATTVKFKVIPISKKEKDKNGNEKELFAGEWSKEQTFSNKRPSSAPSTPSIEINEHLELLTRLDGINIQNADYIEFQVVEERSPSDVYKTQKIAIRYNTASTVFYVTAGGNYMVRARAWNKKADLESEWSAFSAPAGTIPEPPLGITTIRAESKTSVYLRWDTMDDRNTKTYDIEYATKEEYLGSSDQTTVKTGVEGFHYIISGLTGGEKYFFRVRAVNGKGESSWTKTESIVLGTKPAAPTTWSSTTTSIVGEPLTLFWVHNSEDGSRQTLANLELYVDDQKIPLEPIKYPEPADEDEEETISHYDIDTTDYPEGTNLKWRVQTAGITNELGDWSVQRTVDIYARPTLSLRVTDINSNHISALNSFPFYVYGLAGPNTQQPIGYHLMITSNERYETVDEIGNPKVVNVGDQVYSKYFDIQDALLVEMSANNVDLENNIEYTLTCTASMNSGLTAEASVEFRVQWDDAVFYPNASVGLNSENLTTTIQPYCENVQVVYYKVTYANGAYTKTAESVGWMAGDVVSGARTTTGERVYSGMTGSGEEIYYCTVTESTPVTDIYLSVYRREFDGSFTELAKKLDGAYRTTVVDPHPSLDYARYRIVATSKTTGSVSFTDLPGHPVNGKAVIIQWDEEWTDFEVDENATMVRPPWTGSLLKLPYNIDVSDNNKADVALVEYIGRAHPVSYYGTQLGQSATWSVQIPKSDKETIYALRRLSRWMGDVYVREPSGSGYWANITVSFDQKHKTVNVPVTLDIKRVEGGA